MAAVVLASCLVAGACSGSSAPSATQEGRSSSTTTSPAPSGSVGPTEGALTGLAGFDGTVGSADRRRLVAAAEDVVDRGPHAEDPLRVTDTDGPFVRDAQAAWTLALASHVTGEARYGRAAADIVDAWVSTARSTEGTCARSGACATSLMVSRSAPGLVFAVDALVATGRYTSAQQERFHRWLRRVVLPAASDRDNNWGDAGTYLRAVIGVELGDRGVQEEAAELWRARLDLMESDGVIPEELRRGDASLMYSQDALDYKVATADVLARAGIDLWDHQGEQGGTLRRSLDLVAAGLDDPDGWPGGEGDLRIPDPSGVWAIAADHWGDPTYRDLAAAAAGDDGEGHSAVIWTHLTHEAAR
ncbi:hypothetical protein BH10ACT1_BH10ACT1_22610 [soil metagenome]